MLPTIRHAHMLFRSIWSRIDTITNIKRSLWPNIQPLTSYMPRFRYGDVYIMYSLFLKSPIPQIDTREGIKLKIANILQITTFNKCKKLKSKIVNAFWIFDWINRERFANVNWMQNILKECYNLFVKLSEICLQNTTTTTTKTKRENLYKHKWREVS